MRTATYTARLNMMYALNQSAQAGAEVDRERGWIEADGAAVGFGEQLAGIALEVLTEALGPSGRD